LNTSNRFLEVILTDTGDIDLPDITTGIETDTFDQTPLSPIPIIPQVD